MDFSRIKRMMQRWGAHPEGHKRPAADTGIVALPIPPLLTLPLAQHVGVAARPVVEPGTRVLRGQLLAASQGNISAPLHAPTSGIVRAICDAPVPHPSGLAGPAILLETDGLDEALPLEGADPFTLSPQDIAARVAAAGVVGLGGATFPSAVKLSLGHRSQVHTLIINGGECEPYLSCDDRSMRERADRVVDGARIILRATGAARALVGIEDNKPEAITAMRAAAAPFDEVRVTPVPSRYPMGSDRQLIITLTGIEVPADGRAADVGLVVHNVGTAVAVSRAVRDGEPLIRRVVTVSGGAVRTPRNLEVLIGTPARALVDFCGGLSATPARYVMGGPMMGTVIHGLDVPVIKGTSGILALTPAEIGEDREVGPCIRCGSCVTACPVGLLPLEMAGRIRVGELAASVDLGLKDCIGCGTCSYVCPSRIPLVHFFNHAKGELAAQDRARLKSDAIKQLVEARNTRMEKEAREKAEAAARRKAEREKAKAAAAAQASTASQGAERVKETV